MDTALPHDRQDVAEKADDTSAVPATAIVEESEAIGTNPESAAEAGAESVDPEGKDRAEAPASEREAFDAAIQKVLSSSGGELLFRIPSQPISGEEIAAVRLGQGEARLLALVILPQGAPLRVEPVEDSANPLAPIVQSYASLVDAWKTAA